MADGGAIAILIIASFFIQPSLGYSCTSEGRFNNDDTEDCSDYYLCSLSSIGSYFLFSFKCSDGLFNPMTSECDALYNSCGNISKKSISTKAYSFTCPSQGRHEDISSEDCKRFFICNKTSDGIFDQINRTCSGEKRFDPISKVCTLDYVCDKSTTTIEETTTGTTTTEYTSTSSPFVCAVDSKQQDPSVEDCKGYTICKLQLDGTYVLKNRICFDGKSFNPTTQKCQLAYACPSSTTTKETSTVTSTENIPTPTETDSTISPTTTTPFTCPSQGRHEDLSSEDCKRFFICNKTSDSIFDQISRTCSGEKRFDPISKVCTLDYVCDKSTTTIEETTTGTTTTEYTSTSSPFVCAVDSKQEDPSVEDCKGYTICKLQLDGTYVLKNRICFDGKSFNPTTQKCQLAYACPSSTTTKETSTVTSTENIPTPTETDSTISPTTTTPFTCPSQGRHEDLSSEDCKRFFICNKTSDGIFDQISRTCSGEKRFDPISKVCTLNYVCDKSTTTIEETTTYTKTTEYTSNPCSTEITTTMIPTTPFVCTVDSKQEDPSVEDCKGFTVCKLQLDGTYVLKNRICVDGKSFNPTTQTCQLTYACPSSTTTETTTIENTSTTIKLLPSICTSEGRQEDSSIADCKGFIICTLELDGTYSQVKRICGEGRAYNPTTQRCNLNYVCPSLPTSTEAPSTTTISVPQATCNSEGRQEDLSIADCKGFIICTLELDDTYSQVKRICGEGRAYNPTTQRCNLNYVCPSLPTSTESPSTTTMSVPQATCNSEGRQEDSSIADCKGFIICTLELDGTYSQVKRICGEGRAYNPTTQRCNLNYVCPSLPTSTEAPSTTTMSVPQATCNSEGRQEDSSIADCKGFIICTLELDGTYSQVKRICGEGRAYNPTTQRCNLNYVCPSLPTSTESPSTTTMSVPQAICNSEGRQEDSSIADCKGFIICTLELDGTYSQVKRICGEGRAYNPTTKRCNLNYVCPSLPTSTTTPPTTSTTTTPTLKTTTPNTKTPTTTTSTSTTPTTTTPTTTTPTTTTSTSITPTTTTPTTTTPTTTTPTTTTPTTTTSTTISPSTTPPTTTKSTTTTSVTPSGCISVGKFEDPSVENCKGYIVCSLLADGTYKKVHQICADGRAFNPSSMTCQISYVCPSLTTTSTSITPTMTTPTTTTSTSTTPTTTTPTTTTPTATTPTTTTSTTTTPTTTTTTTISPSTTTPTTTKSTTTTSVTPSGCISVGKFEDPSVENCKGYIVCSLLADGTYKKVHQICADGRAFNPSSITCQISYVCPSLTTTSTSITPTTTTPTSTTPTTTTPTTTTPTTTTPTTTTPTTTTPTTTTPTTTTTTTTIAPVFSCKVAGIFEDKSVAGCKGYIVCNPEGNSLILYKYVCAGNTIYDPMEKSCSGTNICPSTTTSTSTTPTIPTTTTSTTTTPTTTTTTTISPSTTTPTTTKSTTTISVTPSGCISVGKFEDLSVENCKGYIVCSLLADGTYKKVHQICADGRAFNPSSMTCQISYVCPSLTTTSTSITPTTTTPTSTTPTTTTPTTTTPTTTTPTTTTPTTTTPTTTTPTTTTTTTTIAPVFSCKVAGIFEDKSVAGCKGYIVCNPEGNSLILYKYVCAGNTIYDPSEKSCSGIYICPQNI